MLIYQFCVYATHSSILAWRIPWTEEPGRLQSMGSQKSQTQLSDGHLATNEKQSVHLHKAIYSDF